MEKKLTTAQIRGILEQLRGGELSLDQIVELTIRLQDHHTACERLGDAW